MELSDVDTTTIWLWLAIIASGLYHGINPGMGWPLAVSAGLMDRSPRAVFGALLPLSTGHLAAMLLVLLPFALLIALAEWQRPIQMAAAIIIIGFGLTRLIIRRHPRALARIPPTRLALWSFAVAIAHGAGLMLLPIYLGLCATSSAHDGHTAAQRVIDQNLAMALLVALVHTAAMLGAGGLLAWLVYRYLGVKFVARSWFNLETVWAVSLVLVGVAALAVNVAEWR
ncbi:membrane protein [Bradyrhizobium sp. NAS96.2]|nr:membrane protein [Bradyrhizobium sp. NAS96.2]